MEFYVRFSAWAAWPGRWVEGTEGGPVGGRRLARLWMRGGFSVEFSAGRGERGEWPMRKAGGCVERPAGPCLDCYTPLDYFTPAGFLGAAAGGAAGVAGLAAGVAAAAPTGFFLS